MSCNFDPHPREGGDLSGFLRPDNDDGRINLVKVENLLQLVYPPVVSEGVILPLALPGIVIVDFHVLLFPGKESNQGQGFLAPASRRSLPGWEDLKVIGNFHVFASVKYGI